MKLTYPLSALTVQLVLCAALVSCSGTDTTADLSSGSDNANANEKPKKASKDFTYSFADESRKFIVPTTQSSQFSLPSGSVVKIPANCFVDRAGNLIKDKVDIMYNEYLTPGSIIASGINMVYDSAGKKMQFESAGMFKILAYSNGEPVFIAKDKSIDVSLATVDDDNNFNTYYSAAVNGNNWQYLDRSQASTNESRQQKITAASAGMQNINQPVKPTPYSANGKYFDLNLKNTRVELYKNLVGVVWEYVGDKPLEDPALNTACFNRKWDYVNIFPAQNSPRGVYSITMKNSDTTVRTTARPVFTGKMLDGQNEEFEQELARFNEAMAKVKNQMDQANAESPLLRSISIKNLGLYNYDRQYHLSDAVPVLANFDFGHDSLKSYPITVYLITGNGMAVVCYPESSWSSFRYSRADVNKLIAILPSQEICTFSAQRFKTEGPVFPLNKPGEFLFKLHRTGKFANKSKDLDEELSAI